MTMNAHYDFLLGRFAKAATLAFGFGTVWFAAALWLGNAVWTSWSDGGHRMMEVVRVASDGTPLIDSYSTDGSSRETVRDLDGRELDGRSIRDVINALIIPGGRRTGLADLSWASRVSRFVNDRDTGTSWYFVRDADPRGTGEFVGYDRKTNRPVGRIGLAGFRQDPVPAAERIPVSAAPASSVSFEVAFPAFLGFSYRPITTLPSPGPEDLPARLVHVPFGNLLRVVDLYEGTVRTAFESPEPIVAVAVPFPRGYFGQEEDTQRSLLVRTSGRVFRLDHAYNVVGTFEIPAEVPTEASLYWYESRDGSAAVIRDMGAYASAKRRVTVYQIAADGAIRKTKRLELNGGSFGINSRTGIAIMTAGVPAPVPLLTILGTGAANDPYRDYPASLADILALSLPALAAVGLLALVLAWAAWRRGRAFGLPTRERTAWAAFVLLFGLPGWVGFRLHRSWPARAACPHCKTRASRDREACLACGELFPEPAATGTEIFA